MNKTLVTIFVLLTIGLLIGIVVLDGSNNKKNQAPIDEILNSKTPVYFYETTCPNCKAVEEFMTQNKIEEKVTLTKIEASSALNAKMLVAVANKCNIPTATLGVPLLYADGKCYEGRIEVIKYLSDKAGLVETTVSQSSPAVVQ
jgi:phage FluMu protein Com